MRHVFTLKRFYYASLFYNLSTAKIMMHGVIVTNLKVPPGWR